MLCDQEQVQLGTPLEVTDVHLQLPACRLSCDHKLSLMFSLFVDSNRNKREVDQKVTEE